jgi:hypothetical protein
MGTEITHPAPSKEEWDKLMKLLKSILEVLYDIEEQL